MKALNFTFILLLALTVSRVSGQVFFNLNTAWSTENVATGNLGYVDSQMNSQKGVITVGNEFVQNEGSNALIQYVNNLGDLEWELSYDQFGHDDYAAAVAIDEQDFIYVSGASFDPSSEDYDFLFLKISPNGQVMNSLTIDYGIGQNNYCTDIQARSGIAYLTGTVENSVADYDVFTVAINAVGQVAWSAVFGSPLTFDIGAKVGLLPNGVAITGGTGTAFDSWQFVTVRYDLNGNQVSSAITGTGAPQFTAPISMITNEDGSIVVLGQTESAQGDQDIVLTKMDENLNVVWQYIHDQNGLEDIGTSVKRDSDGSYILSGWFTASSGRKELAIIKVDGTGFLVWSRSVPASSSLNLDLQGMAVDLYLGEYYVAGVMQGDGVQKLAVLKAKSNGTLVWRYYGELSDDYRVSSVDAIDSSAVRVSGLSSASGVSKYITLQINSLMRENIVSIGSGQKHVENQMIVKFKKEYLDSTFIYNSNRVFGKMEDVLTPFGLSKFETCIGREMKDYSAVKVYKGITPLNRYSLTRQGDTIPIPDFWTSMVILVDSSLNIENAIHSLNQCNEVVSTAQKNFVYNLDDCETSNWFEDEGEDYGSLLTAEDEYFFLQESITTSELQSFTQVHDSDNDGNADGNILTEDAWCYTVGRNDIVVGVIDDKIDFTHEDLRDDVNGYIISGWDFFQNTEINDESLIGNEFHGTRVAGIIGALRNNGLGVVGIAGGDYRAVENTYLASDPTAPLATDVKLGVQLNAYMVGQGITIFSEQAAEALLMSVTNDFEMNWGDACHIINNSWGTTAEGLEYPWRLLTDYDFEIAKNYWFANRNGVVNFTARGNRNTNGTSDRVVYPSCFYDHWLVSVGASDQDGKATPNSLTNLEIDVLGPEYSIALGTEWNVYTTTFDQGQAIPYSTFNGTSSGTPHAAGVGSLMLSYHNDPGATSNNLYPSDVEHLMEMSSSNYVAPGNYTLTQGWGVVKAQRALEYLEAPNYVLGHYNEEFDTSQLQLIAQSDILTIPIVSGDGFELSEGDYLVDRYMIEEQVTFVSPPNTIATSAWARPEATNCYPDLFVSGSNNYLFLDEFCEVSNLSNLSSNQVTLRGFVYHVLSEVNGGVVDLWFPSEGFFSIPYTVHFMDNTPISTLELDQHSFELFPNPVVDVLQIKGLNFESALRFEIMSVNGAKVLSGTTMGVISLSGLSPGLYIARFYLEDSLVSKKIIKL